MLYSVVLCWRAIDGCLFSRLALGQGVSTGVGAAVALYYVFMQLDEEGVNERAYRLAHNHPNNRVERRGVMAAAAGSVLYPVLFDKGVPVVTRVLRGASFGYAAGIVVALILEGFFKRK